MRKIKIAADSAANMQTMSGVDFAAAPLKIITSDREFTDDASLDTDEMTEYFASYKGKSKTSCPNPSDWLEAFEGADDIFCITITSHLSGSYNSACAAKEIYESEHEGSRVFVIDSLSTGPEMELIAEKLRELIDGGKTYEEICAEITAYKEKTGLLFMLESLKNLAANGRVSHTVARIAGLLGIRLVCKASECGEIEPLHKCRGEARSLETLTECLKKSGLGRGKVRIAHCKNPEAAQKLRDMILAEAPDVDIAVSECGGLCGFYAERGGLLVGFEKF